MACIDCSEFKITPSHTQKISYRSLIKSFLWMILFGLFISVQVFAESAAIASSHPYATQVGEKILQEGGNAFDAAVAMSTVLGVAEPFGSGLGGGGFFLFYHAKTKSTSMIDAREIAPMASTPDMYVANPQKSLDGALAAAIPGLPAGIVFVNERYGSLPLKKLLEPAIQLAREGFWVNEPYIQKLQMRYGVIKEFPSSGAVFLQRGLVPELGSKVTQSDLANTLQQLAEKGLDGFYDGEVAKRLVESVQRHGGIWTLDDLKNYSVKERKPMVVRYRDYIIHTASLPSSGGVVLVEMLNMLERFDLKNMTPIARMHVMTEVMRRAYRDRAAYLGDSDFVTVPIAKLTSKSYAAGLLSNCRLDKATLSESLVPVEQKENDGQDTTHFSVIDSMGNRVAATLSINYAFGSGLVAEGTGVLLNNQMDDFVSEPGKPNVYGLVGNRANGILPGKRPLSSMTPTFVENEDGLLILGTPGGSRIISMVLAGIISHELGMTPDAWLAAPRFHHQYLPDVIEMENGVWPQNTLGELKNLGHQVKVLESSYGNMQVIFQGKYGDFAAYSDPRGVGEAVVFEVKEAE